MVGDVGGWESGDLVCVGSHRPCTVHGRW